MQHKPIKHSDNHTANRSSTQQKITMKTTFHKNKFKTETMAKKKINWINLIRDVVILALTYLAGEQIGTPNL